MLRAEFDAHRAENKNKIVKATELLNRKLAQANIELKVLEENSGKKLVTHLSTDYLPSQKKAQDQSGPA